MRPTWTFVGCLLTCVLLPHPVLAEPSSQPTALVHHKGEAGIWFPIKRARHLLGQVKTLSATRNLLETTQKRLKNEKARSALLSKQIGSSEKIGKLWKTAAENQARLLASARAWHKEPQFWLAVGAAFGVALTISVAVLMEKSQVGQ